jgi:hypothetical protein
MFAGATVLSVCVGRQARLAAAPPPPPPPSHQAIQTSHPTPSLTIQRASPRLPVSASPLPLPLPPQQHAPSTLPSAAALARVDALILSSPLFPHCNARSHNECSRRHRRGAGVGRGHARALACNGAEAEQCCCRARHEQVSALFAPPSPAASTNPPRRVHKVEQKVRVFRDRFAPLRKERWAFAFALLFIYFLRV